MTRPLDGVRVLDLSRVLTGPHCTRMLCDLGADVIKVEPPEGDVTRFSFPRPGSIATYFIQQNCGKRNLSLDLRRPEGVELVARLAEHVDVVVENFRPGVLDRLGLGWTHLSGRNPLLVYASITGYGHTGPWTRRRAYAAVVQAETGLTYEQGRARGGRPQDLATDPRSHGDLYASLECLAGVLAALYSRERTGVGQWVEVSMAGSLLAVDEHLHWHLLEAAGLERTDVPSFAPEDYPVLPTAEGHAVAIAGHPASNGTFQSYMRAIGRADLIDDPRFATVADRLEHLDAIHAALRAWAAEQDDLDAVEDAFAAEGLAMGVVRSAVEIAESDWARQRNAIVAVSDRAGGEVRITNSPWQFSAATSGVRGEAAYRGEHNHEILREVLDLDDDELARLDAEGVLSARGPRR